MTVTPISPTNPAAATGAGAAAAPRSTFANGNFETFLRMLTTQLKNQDPTKPMENSEFAVQLATFSGVEQQVRTNQLLEGLGGAASGGLAQYADWIGKEVRSTAPVQFTDRPVTLQIEPDASADTVVLVARDAAGKIATSEDIGKGTGAVDWFGRDAAGTKLADGNYTFELESWKDGTRIGTKKVESYARVTEAESSAAGVTLVTEGGVRVVASTVTALRDVPAVR